MRIQLVESLNPSDLLVQCAPHFSIYINPAYHFTLISIFVFWYVLLE